jgi:outer membrane protein assembly factor BamE
MSLTAQLTHNKLLKQLILLSGFLFLSSCSYFMPHRIDIQQGNIIDQEQVNQLKTGMRKDQVQFILGTPMLMDMFHANRWDYIHTMKKGHAKMEKTRLSLYFTDDELTNIIGDRRPGVAVKENRDKNAIITVPIKDYEEKESKSWYSWMMWWKDDKKEAKKSAGEPQT